MKNKIGLLFLFIVGMLHAQESYYKVEVFGEIEEAGCGNPGLKFIKIIYMDNTSSFLYNGDYFENDTFGYSTNIFSNKKVKRFEIRSKRQSNNWGGCNNIDSKTKLVFINGNMCYDEYVQDPYAGVTDGWVKFKITPIIILAEPGLNDFISSSETINIGLPSTNIAPEYFNWAFKVQDGSWTSLPNQFNNESYLSIKGEDFLNKEDYGQTISFQILTYCNLSSSNIILYKALWSAPHIIQNPITTDVSCYGSNDGSVTLFFDRDLKPGEILALEIVDPTEQTGVKEDNTPIFEKVGGVDNLVSLEQPGNKLTVNGLPGSSENFLVNFVGFQGHIHPDPGSALYTDDPDHTVEFSIEEPTYLQFTGDPTTNMVKCYGGSDGSLSFGAEGGTPPYEYKITRNLVTIDNWTPFNNGDSHTRAGLPKETYRIYIRDSNGCEAKEPIEVDDVIELGDVITKEVMIEEPSSPLQMVWEGSKDASGAGFTDGYIRVRVFGGTPLFNGTYNVIWKNNDNVVLNTVETLVIPDGYLVTLTDIGAGNYLVYAADANYIPAIQKQGCKVNMELSIAEPPPLEVSIEETNPISCNNSNQFNNPYSDGELVAHGEGGVPLGLFDNGGLPYYYTWKKEDKNGVWQELVSENSNILENVGVGRYSVNIRDKNNVIIGEYVNNILVAPHDVIYDLKQPAPITILFEKGDASCNGGNEGWAKATITGGTGTYDLKWSNGEITDQINSLESGNYLLFVTDEKGCQATGQVIIEAPNGIAVTIDQEKSPTCNNGADGAISLLLHGGVLPYAYKWYLNDILIDGENGSSLSGLVGGKYSIVISDSNLCMESVEIILNNPSPNLIDLGEDRLLCGGQTIILNATYGDENTSYLWTSNNGLTSTSPIIEIAEAGIYSVAITTSLGCFGGDTIEVTTSQESIDAHFVVSTQAFAGEELALVNISEPLGETVEWLFPPEATIVAENNETVILLFDEPGAYDVILRSHQGACFIDFMKTVIVGEAADIPDIGDAELPFIQDFKIYPNPSNGNFKVDITLSEESNVSLKLFSMATQNLVNERKEGLATNYSLDYGVALASGSYLLLLETAKASEIRKILIE